jgi:hypothetical protein
LKKNSSSRTTDRLGKKNTGSLLLDQHLDTRIDVPGEAMIDESQPAKQQMIYFAMLGQPNVQEYTNPVLGYGCFLKL